MRAFSLVALAFLALPSPAPACEYGVQQFAAPPAYYQPAPLIYQQQQFASPYYAPTIPLQFGYAPQQLGFQPQFAVQQGYGGVQQFGYGGVQAFSSPLGLGYGRQAFSAQQFGIGSRFAVVQPRVSVVSPFGFQRGFRSRAIIVR